jgi:hypothetical protein
MRPAKGPPVLTGATRDLSASGQERRYPSNKPLLYAVGQHCCRRYVTEAEFLPHQARSYIFRRKPTLHNALIQESI